MNLAQLRAFHAVAVNGGFSAAALALGISQSAVTQHIKALEEGAGTRLFNRQSGRSELTADGLDLWPMVRQVVLQLDEIGLRLDRSRDLVGGHLSLGVCAPHLVMPLIERFRKEFPSIRVRLTIENSRRLLDLVADHAVDLALATMRAPEPGFVCHRFVTQRVLLLVPAGHPLAERDRVRPGELKGVTLVAREVGSMTRQLFEEGLAEAGVAVEPAMVFGGREAVKEAVAAGLGVGYVLDHEIGRDSRLVGMPLEGKAFVADEYLVSSQRSARTGAVGAFIALAAQRSADVASRRAG